MAADGKRCQLGRGWQQPSAHHVGKEICPFVRLSERGTGA